MATTTERDESFDDLASAAHHHDSITPDGDSSATASPRRATMIISGRRIRPFVAEPMCSDDIARAPAKRNAHIVMAINWSDLEERIRSLNARCKREVHDGRHLVFMIQKDSAKLPLLWKLTIRICAIRIHKTEDGDVIEAYQLLKLGEFLNYDDYVKGAMSAVTLSSFPGPSAVSAAAASAARPSTSSSAQLTNCSMASSVHVLGSTALPDGTCLVCMDAPPDTFLACTHSFCYGCLATWHEYRPVFRCPLCKIRSDPDKESWVVEDAPSHQEAVAYLRTSKDERIAANADTLKP